MHLATAAGAQVIAIFGPTDFKINGRYGTRSHYYPGRRAVQSMQRKGIAVTVNVLPPLPSKKFFRL